MFPAIAPPPWTNQTLILYHGTLRSDALNIVSKVDITKGRTYTDFGQGFYTTTILRQAQSWAWMRSQRKGNLPWAVVKLEVDRNELAGLQALWFVRGSFDADDFWSLVSHCRTGKSPHGRGAPAPAVFDIVIGPAAASWRQRLTIFDADQVSFHTDDAEAVLNGPNCVLSII